MTGAAQPSRAQVTAVVDVGLRTFVKSSAHPGCEHATATRYPGGSWGEFRAPGRRGGGWLCRESALVLRRATVRPDGQAPAGSDWGGEHLCHRIEGAVDGGLGDVGESEVVVAGIGPQPGEGLVQMEAGAF
jgi:hypothetical protein